MSSRWRGLLPCQETLHWGRAHDTVDFHTFWGTDSALSVIVRKGSSSRLFMFVLVLLARHRGRRCLHCNKIPNLAFLMCRAKHTAFLVLRKVEESGESSFTLLFYVSFHLKNYYSPQLSLFHLLFSSQHCYLFSFCVCTLNVSGRPVYRLAGSLPSSTTLQIY